MFELHIYFAVMKEDSFKTFSSQGKDLALRVQLLKSKLPQNIILCIKRFYMFLQDRMFL